MVPNNEGYDITLKIFQQAVEAFACGDIEQGNRLLLTIDLAGVESDRAALHAFARTAKRPSIGRGIPAVRRPLSSKVKRAVQERDSYRCRFTGRRLIDPRVFSEVARISTVFHFDAHHSVRETKRGKGGHPMVRTHGAAYEHAMPHSFGGESDESNIVHTSVQLNESKGAAMLPLVDVPLDSWRGLTEYLPHLRRQRAVQKVAREVPRLEPRVKPRVRAPQHVKPGLALVRQAAVGLGMKIFAAVEDDHAEMNFATFISTRLQWFFVTQSKDNVWSLHRLACSSLVFHGDQKLTVRPKLCAADDKTLLLWAARYGVELRRCKRCCPFL